MDTPKSKKLLFLTLSLLLTLGTVAGQTQVEGLNFEEVNPDFQEDQICLNTSYSEVCKSPKKLFTPDQIGDHATISGYNYQETQQGERVEWTGYEYETGVDYGSPEVNDLLAWGEGGGADAGSKYPANYFQIGAYSSDLANKEQSLSEVFDYDLKEENSGYNVSWDINVSSHYEHIVVDYGLKFSNSTTTETVETWQDVYSGPETERIPFSDGNQRIYEENGNRKQALDLYMDNQYEEERQITVLLAYNENYSFSEFTATEISHTELADTSGLYSEAENRIQEQGLNQSLLISDTSQYDFKAFNITVPANEVQPLSSELVTGSETFEEGIKMYVLGSIGGTQTTEKSLANSNNVLDGFEDGDYTSNPSWTIDGDSSDLTVVDGIAGDSDSNEYLEMYSDGSSSGDAYAYTDTSDITFEDGSTFSAWIYTSSSSSSGSCIGFNDQNYDNGELDNGPCQPLEIETDKYDVGAVTYSGSSHSWSEQNTDKWYKIEFEFYPSNGDLIVRQYDSGLTKLEETNLSYDGHKTFDRFLAYGNTDFETTEYFVDSVEYSAPNSAPNIDAQNTVPTNWSISESIDIGFNLSDPDGDSINTIQARMWKDGTVDKAYTSLNTGSEYDYKLDSFYTPDSIGNYTLQLYVEDSAGSSKTRNYTQELDNSGPVISNVDSYKVYEETGGLSYCGRNDVMYSSGTTDIEYEFSPQSPGENHTVYVGRIKNTNTMDVVVNGNTLETLGSTSGSGCNNDNWVVNQVDVPASDLTGDQDFIQLQPSGTDNNYVRILGLAENTPDPLFRDGDNYLVTSEVEDPEGDLGQVNTSTGVNLKDHGFIPGTNKTMFTGSIGTGSTWKAVDIQASDGAGLTNTETKNMTVDYQLPDLSNIFNYDQDLVISEEKSSKTFNFSSNVSDPEGNLEEVGCSMDGSHGSITNSSDKYTCSFTVDSGGTFNLSVNASDSVGHSNKVEDSIQVTQVERFTEYPTFLNKFQIGNTSKSSSNTERKVNSTFQWIQDLNITGTANDTTEITEEIELTDIKEFSIENVTDSSLVNQTLNYSIRTNNSENQTDTSRELEINVKAGEFHIYWQNEQDGGSKRFYRMNTDHDYNRTLKAEVTFLLKQGYDPASQSPNLIKCDNPSNDTRYGCDGTQTNVKEVGVDLDKDGTKEAVKYNVTFSDAYYYTDIDDTPEEEQTATSGGDTGGGTPAQSTGSFSDSPSDAIVGVLPSTDVLNNEVFSFTIPIFGYPVTLTWGLLLFLAIGLLALYGFMEGNIGNTEGN